MTQPTLRPNMAAMPKQKRSAGRFLIDWAAVITLVASVIAFTVLGLAGLFSKQRYGFFIGTVVGALARFLVHYVVGATVWAEYMPETFFGMTMHSPWFYSLLYNGSFILIDLALCLLLGWALWKPLGKYIRGEDIGR